MLLTDAQEDSLRYVTSCLAELAKQGMAATLHEWLNQKSARPLLILIGDGAQLDTQPVFPFKFIV